MPGPPTRSELLKGTRLGSYEVGGLIGHGGMGSVFEGHHVALAKPVALKVLHEHIAQNEASRARFVREARLAATLEHPHVVNILDVGVEGAIAYLVMELLQGEDLAAHLRREKKLGIEAALAIFMPVASALAFAHVRGIVHRDLKPANVFLARDRHGEILPKLVDFGLSKQLLTGEAGPVLTESDAVMGTLEYMGPVQTFGAARAGARSDQYSLAAILYEMVTGHLPFHRGDRRDLLDAIRYAPIVLPSALESDLPSAFDDAVVRALAREPEDRFPDVKAFAGALLPFAHATTNRTWGSELGASMVGQDAGRRPNTEDTDTFLGAPPPPPPLPCAPGSSTFHIKGTAYRSVVRLVERKVPGGLAALDEELGDARISTFVRQQFLAASRYDILPMLPVNVSVARLLGKPLGVIATDQGVAQARYDARYVYRRPFEEMTFETLPAYLVRFASQYFETGEMTAETAGPGHVVLHRRRLPSYVLPWFEDIHAAYAGEVVRLKGARSVRATARPPVEAGSRKGVAVVDLDVDLRWTA